MKSTVLPVLLGLSVLLSTCFAHGFIRKSRAHLCHETMGNKNKNCGGVQYEPQSLEGFKGFPEKGPRDGYIASGDNKEGRFREMDEAGAARWSLVPISTYVTGERDGKLVLDLPWVFTADHQTTTFDYYVSKTTFDPTTVLTRDQLELTPFCVDDSISGTSTSKEHVSRNCLLDATGYSGHHVILGVWNIGDTPHAFYQVIDVDFDAASH